ncbi:MULTISPECIES: NUDIX hydrolase [Photobacterium]|uniref:NUDIX hydrolase n=1 Tax=Photobacterium ganghwense TaxID=320778 RepID=A0A0J1HEF1_9GAMM|nr:MULTISPECIES: NUDIX hydrolase [Photobacterium]KLV10019.1 NUDIX hydrolase [Photobacterium ganghwense]MBV1843314.1 NUDIX hydrolase [Photobacterium ganghwense]PSU09122.1 NUDIX hydrolase [Photobacterium ganghwense]QSV16319.1 NUDIX hydrolase [Photobacterium ganghwense]
MLHKTIRYCSQCGADAIRQQQPPGDTHLRPVCQQCGHVIYQNPTVIAGCIIEHQGKFLLGRRAIEPMAGKWSIPAGFMENGETVEQAAAREVLEETGAKVDLLSPYSIFSVPQMNQVYIIFRARFDGFVQPFGDETAELAFMAKDEVPWHHLTYPAIGQILSRYIHEESHGQFGLYMGNFDVGLVHPFGTANSCFN